MIVNDGLGGPRLIGNPAISSGPRPEALRPRLTTGLPLCARCRHGRSEERGAALSRALEYSALRRVLANVSDR